MLDFIYTIIISPIIIILEIVFELFNKIFKNMGISILSISIVVSVCCLPLYYIAEKWQKTERDTAKKLKPTVDRIKKVFSGNKRYMILSTFYRQNNYHPVYALRSSFGVLIQIPFFIAAFTFLSNFNALKNTSFFIFNDLSSPDSLLTIGSVSINILPVLMTLINLVSGFIYSKGFLLREKIQIFLLPAIFLVLLYNSPSALVIYWTMNNIISLIKNIFYKLKNPKKVLYILFLAVSLLILFYILFINGGSLRKRLYLCAFIAILIFIPLYIKILSGFYNKTLLFLTTNKKLMTYTFLIFAFCMVIIAGFSIPSAVISSSPNDFILSNNIKNPNNFIINTFILSFGFFFFWPACIYFLYGNKIKSIITFSFICLVIYSIINSYIFKGNYGMITNFFQFDSIGVFKHSFIYITINILSILAGVFLVIFLLQKKMIKQIFYFGLVIISSLGIFSLYNSININKYYSRYKSQLKSNNNISLPGKRFNFSKDKPNIIVFMIDAAVSGYVKQIFNDKPELYDIYDGFTFYPNTVSYALHTLMAVPPIWGGYEYTPLEMNKNKKLQLKEKHNQALLLLPTIFSKTDFETTVTNPSWASYESIPDTSIFKNLENVKAFNTTGRYTSYWFQQNNFGNEDMVSNIIKRNMMFFSFLKITPSPFRFVVYDNGIYWGNKKVAGPNTSFFDNYAVMDYLSDLTSFDADKAQVLLISNELTHSHVFLQYPEYIPVQQVTDIGPGLYNQYPPYHTNTAFFILFGRWLNTLKENDAYDNTRIIIVSDHGVQLNSFISDTDIPINGERRESYNPLLLVKDFNSRGSLKTDNTFMTNADVPLITLNGIVNDPINPFSGNILSSEDKKEGVVITINHLPMPSHHKKYVFNIKDDQWVRVKDDILINENWIYEDIK